MRAIIVDDNEVSRKTLERILKKIKKIHAVSTFACPAKASQWLENKHADIAFIEAADNGKDTEKLMRDIRDRLPECCIFIVGWAESCLAMAYRLNAEGYFRKPVSEAEVIAKLKRFHLGSIRSPWKLQVKCFGRFEVFDEDNIPVHFRYNLKTRELFAYLVFLKGSICTLNEIASVIYENRDDTQSLHSQMRNLLSDLTGVLTDIGVENVIYRNGSEIAIVPENLHCDYYDFLKDEEDGLSSFSGEFMSQYSWAQEITEGLLQITEKHKSV